MTGTTDLAVRSTAAPAQHAPGTLAISDVQVAWTPMQDAALNQLGLENAGDGDRLVFLHQCQRTGLDPFAKQIHMLGRKEWDPVTETSRVRWTIQTGIDGFRVNRDRAERKAGVRGILSRPVFYDAEGNDYKVWVKPHPPVAIEITYTVRDRSQPDHLADTPYTSILRFSEYAQYKRDGKLIAKWASSPAHMLEKCTEADVYRKAFPQDFSGIVLDDAMPAPGISDSDEETQASRGGQTAPADTHRVTADKARARGPRPQVVDAVIVDDTPDVPPAPPATPPAAASSAPVESESAGGTQDDADMPATTAMLRELSRQLEQLGYAGDDQRQTRLNVVSRIARKPVDDLTRGDARKVADTLEGLDATKLDRLLAERAMEDDPRDEVPDGQ